MSAISVTWTSGLSMYQSSRATGPVDFDNCNSQHMEYGVDSGSYSAEAKLGWLLTKCSRISPTPNEANFWQTEHRIGGLIPWTAETWSEKSGSENVSYWQNPHRRGVSGSSGTRISIRRERDHWCRTWRWLANNESDCEVKVQRWQQRTCSCDRCSVESVWLIPESTDASVDVPEAAGEPSSTAAHCRMEKKSPQRNIATRIPDCDVDFLAVGFLDLTTGTAWGLSDDAVVGVGAVAVVKAEEEEADPVESSPCSLPVVVSIHLGDLSRCFMNECCLSCSLNAINTHKHKPLSAQLVIIGSKSLHLKYWTGQKRSSCVRL